MMTDPVADMLTRIRNAGRAGHADTTLPSSRMKLAIARVLKDEGFVDDVQVEAVGGKALLRIELRYGADGQLLIDGIRRVSRPSCCEGRGDSEGSERTGHFGALHEQGRDVGSQRA
jgi:small subunit ribosomal protein S8